MDMAEKPIQKITVERPVIKRLAMATTTFLSAEIILTATARSWREEE
jgi:hypothetical protein